MHVIFKRCWCEDGANMRTLGRSKAAATEAVRLAAAHLGILVLVADHLDDPRSGWDTAATHDSRDDPRPVGRRLPL